MIFTTKTESNGHVHIDGYSNKKTVNGALKDLAREVTKYSESEARCIIEAIKFGDEVIIDTEEYKIECEEVGCATKYINDEEVEYKEANYYLHIMYVA